MPQATESRPRSFRVHPRLAGGPSRIVEETSFEAAAIAYVETCHPAVDGSDDLSVIVRDLEDGGERCFRIDLDTGETRSCE